MHIYAYLLHCCYLVESINTIRDGWIPQVSVQSSVPVRFLKIYQVPPECEKVVQNIMLKCNRTGRNGVF